jgi:hypothetical protein
VDLIDLHIYQDPGSIAGKPWTFAADLASSNWTQAASISNRSRPGQSDKNQPLIMGEFGAFRANPLLFPTAGSAATAMAVQQAESCSVQLGGFRGWMMWTWDTFEQPRLWNMMSGAGEIARGLAPTQHPNPCELPDFVAAVQVNLTTATVVNIDRSRTISWTNPEYASWNLDSSADRGFFHINFSNPNLAAAASSLRPSVLRFGGTGNDYLRYGPPNQPCPWPQTSNDSYGCLNTSHWTDLWAMAAASKTKILFGISFDMPAACRAAAAPAGGKYQWDKTNAEQWLRHIKVSTVCLELLF